MLLSTYCPGTCSPRSLVSMRCCVLFLVPNILMRATFSIMRATFNIMRAAFVPRTADSPPLVWAFVTVLKVAGLRKACLLFCTLLSMHYNVNASINITCMYIHNTSCERKYGHNTSCSVRTWRSALTCHLYDLVSRVEYV